MHNLTTYDLKGYKLTEPDSFGTNYPCWQMFMFKTLHKELTNLEKKKTLQLHRSVDFPWLIVERPVYES